MNCIEVSRRVIMHGGVHRCVMLIELHECSPICVHVNASYLKILDHETLLWGFSYGFLPPFMGAT